MVHSLEDAEQCVKCAEQYLQRNGLWALPDFKQDSRWKSGPIYMYLLDRETLIQIMSSGNPQLDGTHSDAAEDSTGYRFVEEVARTSALFGEGVGYYDFNNPTTGKVEPKIAYARNVEFGGFDCILGTGIYIPSNNIGNEMPEARNINTKPEWELFVRCVADLLAARGSEAFDLLLDHRT